MDSTVTERPMKAQSKTNGATDDALKKQLIIFELGEEKYAFDLAKTREVVLTPAISKIPQMPAYIRGVADIRGEILVVINVAQKFELLEESELRERYVIVMETNTFKVGVLVENVPTTVSVNSQETYESANSTNKATLDSNYVKEIMKINDSIVFLLDINELIAGDKINLESNLKSREGTASE